MNGAPGKQPGHHVDRFGQAVESHTRAAASTCRSRRTPARTSRRRARRRGDRRTPDRASRAPWRAPTPAAAPRRTPAFRAERRARAGRARRASRSGRSTLPDRARRRTSPGRGRGDPTSTPSRSPTRPRAARTRRSSRIAAGARPRPSSRTAGARARGASGRGYRGTATRLCVTLSATCSSASRTSPKDATSRRCARSPIGAGRHSSTCTPTPIITARCSRSPGPARTTRRPRRASSPTRSPPTSRSPGTTACTRFSARSTSSRSSRSAAPTAERDARGRRRARVRAVVGRDAPRARCSSTTTPTRPAATFRTSAATRSGPAQPDFGPDAPHPTLGATRGRRAQAARRDQPAARRRDDVAVARRIAREIREQDGGLPGVRALGLMLASVGRPQVSMNLVDLDRTGIEAACLEVRELVPPRAHRRRRRSSSSASSRAATSTAAPTSSCAWAGIDATAAIEARIGHGPAATG